MSLVAAIKLGDNDIALVCEFGDSNFEFNPLVKYCFLALSGKRWTITDQYYNKKSQVDNISKHEQEDENNFQRQIK